MDAKAYEQYVADVVRGLSFSGKAQVFTNKHYRGVRQPGTYEVDVSCEVWIDDALFFLIIVECKNWTRPIDRPQIQKLIQTRDAISAHKAAFASPVGYTKEADEVAEANGIARWVVAESCFIVWGAGGLAALSLCFRLSDYLRTLAYKVINYNYQYTHNLGKHTACLTDVYPDLVPLSWLPSNKDIYPEISLWNYPGYPAVSGYAYNYNPIVSELILHVLAAKPETNTLTQTLYDAITRIRQILRKAGLNARQADIFLRDFVIPMITEGMSIPQFNDQLHSFDKSVPHATTHLLAPMEWLEKHVHKFLISTDSNDDSFMSLSNNIVWANAFWLFSESEATR